MVHDSPANASRSGRPPRPDAPRATTDDLARALERLDDPIVLTEPGDDLAVRYANAAFVRLAGDRAADVLGRPLASVLSVLGGRDLSDELRRALRDRITVALGALAQPREFELSADPLDDDAPAGFVVVLRDVTDLRREHRTSERDRRRLEKLVGERTLKLEEFHERLRLTERLASIGTLGAGLCHDMNNLLMPIRGHLDAIEAAGLDDDQAEHLWSVREAIDYLQQLTNGLRLFALNPDDPGAGRSVADVASWWKQLRPLLARTIPERITFDVQLDDDLPPVAIALHRLTQAALNLLLNAVDAIDGAGSITLRATTSDDRRFVLLSVVDTGRGMTNESQQHALDPFFTTKTRGRSTGLGLSLVHGIVHGAGGRVEIESAVGAGTTVTLHLAAAREEQRAVATESGGLAVVTIDDPRIAACFTSFLRSAGFEVDPNGGPRLGAAAVWVTDASTSALTRARRLADTTPACRVVAYGRRSEAWEDLGATMIDRREGLAGIRQAIQQLMLAAEDQ